MINSDNHHLPLPSFLFYEKFPVKEPLLPGGAPRQAFFSFQPVVLPTPGLEKMSGLEDNAMFLPKQEPIFENGGFPYSAAPPFRNMLSLLKSNDDIFPLPQTAPSASTPKTPPYTGYPVQTVSHIAWHLPVLPSHPPTPWLLPIIHGY